VNLQFENLKSLFDIPDDVTYLNCSYMSPMLKNALEAGIEGLKLKTRPWSIQSHDFFSVTEEVRSLAANIINCDPHDIALIPSASYGLATAASNLSIADTEQIIVLEEEFPSNFYIWQELSKVSGASLITVPRPTNSSWTEAIICMINQNTKIAVLPHCHWTDGSLIDLELIGKHLRKHDAALVVDATQSLGTMPFDVTRVQPDFLISACYKWLLGPYSTGLLYVSQKYQQGTPIEFNWINRANAHDFRHLTSYQTSYAEGARRYDVGERANFALLPALMVGLQQIIEWGIESIYETISHLTNVAAQQAEIRGLAVTKKEARAGHFFGIQLPSNTPDNLTRQLSEQNIFISIRGNSLRITPHVYNSEQDLEILFKALDRIKWKHDFRL